jgi:hypothetical protein
MHSKHKQGVGFGWRGYGVPRRPWPGHGGAGLYVGSLLCAHVILHVHR